MSATAPRAVESRVLIAVLRVVVRDRDSRVVRLREVDDLAEQEPLLAGSCGVGDPMRLEIMLPRVDDHPHRTQQRDEPPQRRWMLGLRIQLTDEEDLLEIRLCFKQLSLDVADGPPRPPTARDPRSWAARERAAHA